MSEDIKIRLDYEDFKCLVSGGELSIVGYDKPIKMILSDIGYLNMQALIEDLKIGNEPAYQHHKRNYR